jgi:hypothetical protein
MSMGESCNSASTSNELSEIPRDYLNQLTVLKHLAKEVQVRKYFKVKQKHNLLFL